MALDITAYLDRSERPHFERKSLFQGPSASRRPRDRRAVRDDIAEQVAALANAEGGVLVLGIEDDGSVTGHAFPARAVETMLNVPADRLRPPQAPGFVVRHAGVELLVFDVQMAYQPVQVVGDGFPLRMGDQTVQASTEEIQALKFRGISESAEARQSPCALADLDVELLARAQRGAGLEDVAVDDYLVRRRLADWRGRSLVLRNAAEWLFSRGLPEHPNAGVRVFRVVGTERKLGLEHNVEELPRIEGAVPLVLEQTLRVVGGLLRRPSRLSPSGLFKPSSEYPEFSWREAILNAVGHRDYGDHGRGVEVWLFDDRMEISSPGGLLPEVPHARGGRDARRAGPAPPAWSSSRRDPAVGPPPRVETARTGRPPRPQRRSPPRRRPPGPHGRSRHPPAHRTRHPVAPRAGVHRRRAGRDALAEDAA